MGNKTKAELLKGTLDMLVLRVLQAGPMHGYGIVRRIQQSSGDLLVVEEGSLYPALHRMERRGWIESEWGSSEANRRAKYYRLTRAGNQQATLESAKWERLVEAVTGVMAFAGGEA